MTLVPIEIENRSAFPMEAIKVSERFDASGWVLSIITAEIQKSKPFSHQKKTRGGTMKERIARWLAPALIKLLVADIARRGPLCNAIESRVPPPPFGGQSRGENPTPPQKP